MPIIIITITLKLNPLFSRKLIMCLTSLMHGSGSALYLITIKIPSFFGLV